MHLSITHLQLAMQQLSRVDIFLKSKGIEATSFTMEPHNGGYSLTHQAKGHGFVLEWRLSICEDRPELDHTRDQSQMGNTRLEDHLSPTGVCRSPRLACKDGVSSEKEGVEKPPVSVNHVLLVVQLRLDEAGPPTGMPMIDLAYFPSDQSWTVDKSRPHPSERTRVLPEDLLKAILTPRNDADVLLGNLQTMAHIFTSTYLQ